MTDSVTEPAEEPDAQPPRLSRTWRELDDDHDLQDVVDDIGRNKPFTDGAS